MEEIKGHIYEKLGYKAYKKGFFKQWQQLTSLLYKSQNIPLHEASEKAYQQLKPKRSK